MGNCEYSMEELLPVIARVTDKFTSKESSSVTYDTARMILEAVVYCVNECFGSENENLLRENKLPAAEIAWERGKQIVLEKAAQANKVYEAILTDFEDYGCMNYKNTILDGIPGFFKKYDPQFKPQDHILTLDYPLISGNPVDLCGINLILEYLKGIQREKRLQDCFHLTTVIALLEEMQGGYRTIYMGNICYPLLLNGIGCMIVERPLTHLILTSREIQEVADFFRDEEIDKIELKLKVLIAMMLQQLGITEEEHYFICQARDYAVRIFHGIENDSLEQVFVSSGGLTTIF